MSWEWAALNQDSLPKADLHGERRAERQRALQKSRRNALMLGALALYVALALAPLSRQVLDIRAQLVRAGREADEAARRLQALTDGSAGVEARLAHWKRYQDSRDRRARWVLLMDAIAASTPEALYYERIQFDAKTQPMEVVFQGAAERIEVVRSAAAALVRTGAFAQARVMETASCGALGPEGVQFKLAARPAISLAATAP